MTPANPLLSPSMLPKTLNHGQHRRRSTKSTWVSIQFLSAPNSNLNDLLRPGSCRRTVITSAFITFHSLTISHQLSFSDTRGLPSSSPPAHILNSISAYFPPANVNVHIPPARFSPPNIKANNDDVLVYGSLLGEFSKMAISFIMSRVCCCCRAIVKIVSASGGCIKKKTAQPPFNRPDLFSEEGKMSKTPALGKQVQVVQCGGGLLYTLGLICAPRLCGKVSFDILL